jgi:hypothetical protein
MMNSKLKQVIKVVYEYAYEQGTNNIHARDDEWDEWGAIDDGAIQYIEEIEDAADEFLEPKPVQLELDLCTS